MAISIRVTQRKIPVDHAFIGSTIEKLRHLAGYDQYDVGCWIASNTKVADLNKRYRNKIGVTDILSFSPHDLSKPEEFSNLDMSDLGDMVIAAEYVHRYCEKLGISESRHYEVLLTHGLVHLIGYDHENDDDYKIMAKKEAELLAKLKELR